MNLNRIPEQRDMAETFIDKALLVKLREAFPAQQRSNLLTICNLIHMDLMRTGGNGRDYVRRILAGYGIEGEKEFAKVLAITHDILSAVIGLGCDMVEDDAIDQIRWTEYDAAEYSAFPG